jgi:cytochrome c oxidase assembly protein subunit 11|tara:strand:- start:227 stop:745 length:519 start_codon:yes stop_codon:yes gene_type:complete
MTSKYRTASLLFALVSLMILLVAFSVPLYNLFCRVTGYGGTTSFSENISNITLDKDITLQFNADVNDSIDWSFTAPQDVTFKIGENKLVEYEATNLSSVSSSGTATFNVLPEKVGPYFIKTQCFCFEKQTLEPNQSVKMPVVFYIDPSITDDPGMADIDTITLSYTFFKYIE